MRSKRVSANVAGIEVSAIKQMAIAAAARPDTVSLAWGVPSFRTPEPIREAVKRALDQEPDSGKYTLPGGLPAFREAVAQRHFERTGIKADPATEVTITAGNIEGLNAIFHTLIDPGDEIIVTDPGFASHIQQIRMCGGTAVSWPMIESDGWALDPASLPGIIGERTKAIVVVSPCNPTGTIFSEEQLRLVARSAIENDLAIIVDDPYSAFLYDNADRYFDLASMPEIRDRLIYLFSFSKCFAMSGYRIGYAVLPAELNAQLLKVHDATLICAPRVSQIGAMAALRSGDTHIEEFRSAIARRRSLICERLDALSEHFSYIKPEGAYYIFPRILGEHESSIRFAHSLLDDAGVSTTPGAAFGACGEHHLRMAFCVEDDVINEAFDRLERWLKGR